MKSKAPLAMMEQMIMVLVFALAAALCLQAFVRSDQMSRRAEARDRAMTLCQTAAEVIRHSNGNFEDAAEKLGLELDQDGAISCYYDEHWEPIPGREGTYLLRIHGLSDVSPGLGKASVSVSEADGEALFELEATWQEVGIHG